MNWYEVKGYIWQEHVCDCPYCKLDGKSSLVIHKVQAYDVEDAANQALQAVEDGIGGYCEWTKPPEVKLIPDDQVMRLAGAPMLPGLAEGA